MQISEIRTIAKLSLAEQSSIIETLFDSNYYLNTYQDILQLGINPLVHFLVYGWREGRNPNDTFDTKQYLKNEPDYLSKDINPFVALVIAQNGEYGPFFFELGKKAIVNKDWKKAEKAFSCAIEYDIKNPNNYERLAYSLEKQKRWWETIDALTAAVNLNNQISNWHYRLGIARHELQQYEDAIIAYNSSLQLGIEQQKHDVSFRIGDCFEKLGREAEAHQAFQSAIKFDEKLGTQKLGVGAYYKFKKEYNTAAKYFKKQTEITPFDAKVWYELGNAYDRAYHWLLAADAYKTALALNLNNDNWHYRYGFVLERAQKYELAVSAYSSAIKIAEKKRGYWNYRLGYVLQKLERYEDACKAYLGISNKLEKIEQESLVSSMDDNDRIVNLMRYKPRTSLTENQNFIPKTFLQIESYLAQYNVLPEVQYYDYSNLDKLKISINIYERLKDWNKVSDLCRYWIARNETFDSNMHLRLAMAEYKLGNFRKASQTFQRSRIFSRPVGINTDNYTKRSQNFKKILEYCEYYETFAIEEQTILYESFFGKSMSGNPYALFKYFESKPEFRNWVHIWVLDDKTLIPEEYKARKDIIFISRDTDRYRRYLATVKYLINNLNFESYFVRKPEQIFLNTWHGTPLRTMGKQVIGFLEHREQARNLLQATHVLSANSLTTDVLIHDYNIEHLWSALLAETGYPRIDFTINATEDDKAKLRNQLGLSKDKKIVLYAPALQGSYEKPDFDWKRIQHDLAQIAQLGCEVLFRNDFMIDVEKNGKNEFFSIVPNSIDTNELLSIVDILITDYSSIFFDFMVTNRPIIHYAYDRETLPLEEGELYLSMTEMPGKLIYDIASVCKQVKKWLLKMPTKPSKKYLEAKNKFCPYEDGKVTKRVYELLFKNKPNSLATNKKKNLLLYPGGCRPNGITTSFLNLCNNIDSDIYNITTFVDPNQVNQPDQFNEINQLPPNAKLIGRTGHMVVSPEERWIMDKQEQFIEKLTSEQLQILERSYKREYIRIFGHAKVHAIINFDGYSNFWTQILGKGGKEFAETLVIYQHNDMLSEAFTRFRTLRGVFENYNYYDWIVAVSEQTRQLNEDNLAHLYNIPKQKMRTVLNSIKPLDILKAAKAPLPDKHQKLFNEASFTFLNVGRLSPEKDHEKLIRAFAKVIKIEPKARLFVLGRGPLLARLEAMISLLNLKDNIFFLGQVPDAASYMREADCFVLSSNHEGQPMVLLEALTLGCPIVATNIVGNRGVLKGKYGLLVENSAEGLIHGMQEFMIGNVTIGNFNAETYVREAMDTFYKIIESSEISDINEI